MTELLYSALTGDLLGAYYAVYNGTGRTYPEFSYENGMVKLIGRMRASYRRQPEYQIVYKDRLVGVQRLDILDVADLSVHNLKDWMRYQGIRLGVLTSFYDTAVCPVFLRI